MEKRKRSVVKAVLWQLLGIITLSLLSFIITGRIETGLRISLIFYLIRIIMYYVYERLWLKVKWGKVNGFCLWLTGLSGAGKTTLAKRLEKEFKKMGLNVQRLDGDVIRATDLCKDLGFSKEDREKNLKRTAVLAKFLVENGVIVIASYISPFEEIRNYLRKQIPNFIEVYVKCDLQTCINRDPKGLYKKALAGEIKNFTGLDSRYEEPKNPDIVVDTSYYTEVYCVHYIMKYLTQRGYV